MKPGYEVVTRREITVAVVGCWWLVRLNKFEVNLGSRNGSVPVSLYLYADGLVFSPVQFHGTIPI